MVHYDALVMEAAHEGVYVVEKKFRSRAKGLCKGNKIGISSAISTLTEKTCILAEELGHYHTTFGDILDQSDIRNRKQELRARTWAYYRLISLDDFISAHVAGIRNRYEFAHFLGVTEEFLQNALDRFQNIYGTHTIREGHMIMFDPLMVIEPIEL